MRAHRQTRAFRFTNELATSEEQAVLLPPIDVFAVAFGLVPDSRVTERVEQLFAGEATNIMNSKAVHEANDDDDVPMDDEAGFIYVFHDAGDPPNVLKIGRTRRDPRRRIAEWERELAPQQGRSVRLLAAYPTLANEFAERIVHEILRCQRIRNRINPVTNDELDEFFLVENLMALKLFLRESLRFIDRFARYWRERRRRRSAAAR